MDPVSSAYQVYELVPFLEAGLNATASLFTAVGASSATAMITAVVLVGAAIGLVGAVFVRVLMALPLLAWITVMGAGVGAIWVLFTSPPPAGIGRLALRALSWIGLLSIGGILTAGIDIRDISRSAGGRR